MKVIKKRVWVTIGTWKLLRYPFSFFLMPVFIFAFSQASVINWPNTFLSFFILHFLVFPSSNGYNSYQDKDVSSIGGLKNPPQVTRNLFYVTLIFDLLALILALFISSPFSLFVAVFIAMSRLYSYRGIRLKKYPIIGFLTVFVFQGGYIFLISLMAISDLGFSLLPVQDTLICMIIASLFMGSVYPLTQIYQHDSDKLDGVTSMSYLLGYHGTFVFSGILFTLASFFLAIYFWLNHQIGAIWVFLVMILPMSYYLTIWFRKVRRDNKEASFENTMTMNIISSASMNLFFLVLALNNYLNWF